MGWTVPYDTPHRADLIRDLTRTQEQKHEDGSLTVWKSLAHCYRGGIRSGVLYAVWEVATTDPKGTVTESRRFIGVYLLKYGNDRQCGSTWGYKDMDCCSGPNADSCPVSYLDMSPPHDGEWCAKWHQRVRERAAKDAAMRAAIRGVKVGDELILKEGRKPSSVTVTSVKPLRGVAGFTTYRISASDVAEVRSKSVTV